MKRKIHVGGIPIGGDAPVSIQSMLNTKTTDVEGSLEQIRRLQEAGCQIVRLAVPDMDAARGFAEIVAGSPLPLVAVFILLPSCHCGGWRPERQKSVLTPAISAVPTGSGPWWTCAGKGAFPSVSASTAVLWKKRFCKSTDAPRPRPWWRAHWGMCVCWRSRSFTISVFP